jgi:hypothetical protein
VTRASTTVAIYLGPLRLQQEDQQHVTFFVDGAHDTAFVIDRFLGALGGAPNGFLFEALNRFFFRCGERQPGT